ncbi:MAG TPA: polysaccharide biosynthesis/export family protein, partial [Thermoanaerobaculia bacterium]|nr:polysaccharide biosynthesis/export family protein [Thermoanaerobaculia bacterium]
MRRIATSLWIGAAALVLALAPARGQGDSSPVYRIGPRDVVRIEVFEEPDLNREVAVTKDGTLRLPLVGSVQAEGLTEEELAVSLQALLEENFLRRASVSVEVVQFLSRPISVLGAVRKPGSLDYLGRVSLLEVLTAAGGLADTHGPTIQILRRASNGLTDQVTIPVAGLLERADADLNLPIFANDLITVPAAEEVTVYLLGEVGGAGAITFRRGERITRLSALARAGGLTERASNKIRIQRRRP